jgi:hypothetical protein
VAACGVLRIRLYSFSAAHRNRNQIRTVWYGLGTMTIPASQGKKTAMVANFRTVRTVIGDFFCTVTIPAVATLSGQGQSELSRLTLGELDKRSGSATSPLGIELANGKRIFQPRQVIGELAQFRWTTAAQPRPNTSSLIQLDSCQISNYIGSLPKMRKPSRDVNVL